MSRRGLTPVRLAVVSFAIGGLAACSDGRAPVAEGGGQITLRVADAAMRSGAPDVAARVADLVLGQEPGNVAAMVAKGDALYAMGEPAAARSAYRQALIRDNASVPALLGLGRTLVRTDPVAAEAAFDAAAERDPGNAAVLNNLGIARDMQGRHAAAQEAYRRAMRADPDMQEVRVNMGMSLALSGDVPAGAEMIRTAQAAPQTPAPEMAKIDAAAVTALENGTADLPVTPAPVGRVAQAALPVREAAVRRFEPPMVVARAEEPVAEVRPAPAPMVAPEERMAALRVRTGHVVQLAAVPTEAGAHSEWDRLRRRMPTLLADRDVVINHSETMTRFGWRLRTTRFETVDAARSFCGQVKEEGGDCWVL